MDPQLMFVSDEMWFHVSGHINEQNVRLWNNEDPHAIWQVPLHSEKVGILRALSPWQVTGCLLVQETVDSDCYISHMLNPFFNQPTVEGKQYGYFQQNNATVYPTNSSMGAIWEVSEDRLISRGL
jgi:hypothetical protein